MIDTTKYDSEVKEWEFDLKMDLPEYNKLKKKYMMEYKELCDTLPEKVDDKLEQAKIFNTMLKFWHEKLPAVRSCDIRYMNPRTTARYYLVSSTINELQFMMQEKLDEFDK